MHKVELWTDGSCDNDNGIGGWAYAIVEQPENELACQKSEGVAETTNNRMELMAVIEGLRAIDPRDQHAIEVISDSAYVVNCFFKKWYLRWMNNGWRNSEGAEVKNKDLWEILLQEVIAHGGRVTWRHERAHQKKGTLPYNELVDELAGSARRVLLDQINNNNLGGSPNVYFKEGGIRNRKTE